MGLINLTTIWKMFLYLFPFKDLRLFDNQDYNFEVQNFEAPTKIVSTSLNPIAREISLNESAHLLRRTVVGPTIEEIGNLSVLNISDAVDYILREIPEPSSPGEWVDDPFPFRLLRL